MTTSEAIVRKVNQLEWTKDHTKRVNDYRAEHGLQPPFITEDNPHSFTHQEILKLTSAQLLVCSIVEDLMLLK